MYVINSSAGLRGAGGYTGVKGRGAVGLGGALRLSCTRVGHRAFFSKVSIFNTFVGT